MIPVLSSKKASELPVDEVASILQVSNSASLKAVLMLQNVWRFLRTVLVTESRLISSSLILSVSKSVLIFTSLLEMLSPVLWR